MRFMLDTTFVIDHLRNDLPTVSRFRRLLEEGDEALITSIVVSEAWAGATGPTDDRIEGLFRSLEYIHLGPDGARRAGYWRSDARRRGYTLGLADALIAATAYDEGAYVLTRNVRDFALTPVRVETY